MKNSLNKLLKLNDILYIFEVRNILVFSKKYIWYFVFLLFFVFCTFCLTVFFTLDSYSSYTASFIDNMVASNDKDIYKICEVINCDFVYILSDKKMRKLSYNSISNKMVEQEEASYIFSDLISLNNNKFFNGRDLLIYNKELNTLFSVSFERYTYLTIKVFSIFLFFMIIIFLILTYNTYKRERIEALLQTIGSEAILSNKSMVMITENVHHELNTPIEIIDNKIEKIHRIIKQYLLMLQAERNANSKRANNRVITEEKRIINGKMEKLENDFEFIRIAFEQMFAVLNKMKNFKSLRYSNGDKTIYDIIDGSFRIISISNSDFVYHVDEEFKNYRMISPTFKNIDLLNVLINHFKNSLEANANRIEVTIDSSNFSQYKKINIRITDNGNGIQENIKNKIFQPNLSTKAIGNTIRGNGMYINKHILSEAGGNVKIISTSNKGTTIGVSLPVKYLKFEENED